MAVVSRSEQVDELTALKTHFLASLNHEVRTPLTGILGMTDLLLETPLSEDQKEYVATARNCADELLALFSKTLEFSEISSGKLSLSLQEMPLAESLRSVVAAFTARASEKGLSLHCRLAGELPDTVISDAARLQEILSHILENAIKFTEKGKVEVTASGSRRDQDFTLTLSVRDTGIGIPPDRLLAVFDAFRQLEAGLARRYNGLGLGLSLVQQLTSLMGGNVAVESEAGKGSVFTVTIPLQLPPDSAQQPAGSMEHEPATSVQTGKPRILFVDDNAVARRIVSHVLSRAQYEIVCAAGGRSGIELAAEQRFDLILVDLQMPEMDGLATVAHLRNLAHHRATPVIALTANATEQCRRECRQHGIQGFVPKPVLADQLLAAISEALA